MKNVTIILGPERSGKLHLALELATGKKACVIDSSVHKFDDFSFLDPKTEILIIDNIISIDQVKKLILSESISFRPPYSKSNVDINPDLIITSNKLTSNEFSEFIGKSMIKIFQLASPDQIVKAQKWDELDEEVYKFYFDENDEELLEPNGDLGDIGELAARKLGYL